MKLCYIFRNPPELCYGDLHTRFYSGPDPFFYAESGFYRACKISHFPWSDYALKYAEIRRYSDPDPANIGANYPDPANSEKIISGHSLIHVRQRRLDI